MSDISLGALGHANLDALQFGALENLAESQKGGLEEKSLFSISEATVGPSDGVEEISDAALTRTDSFGLQMAAAFNLPPPTMPTFNA